MNLVYITLATSVPYAIVSEAWLSWLGLYDPTIMTWGRMLYDAQSTAIGIKMWWWIVPPGVCIALISLSFILLGYALDEVLNPKLRKRY
jgi:peptide/nickel transport system permease protein